MTRACGLRNPSHSRVQLRSRNGFDVILIKRNQLVVLEIEEKSLHATASNWKWLLASREP